MSSIRRISFYASIVVLLSGCTYYDIHVNGFMDTSKNSMVKQGALVTVLDDSNAANSLQEKEVKAKIEKLLVLKGYKIGTLRDIGAFRDTDYFLLFGYGVGNGQTVSGRWPFNQSDNSTAVSTIGTYRSPMATGTLPGTPPIVPVSQTVYRRWLVLKLIDGDHYRDTREARDVWIGEAASTGISSDIRVDIDYLLISAFDHFCENTGKQVTETMYERDERVKNLNASQ